ncbi:MAG TPA: DNA-directed RNA polymerase subunit alpha, partial [bacterium]|nr:DNA-directed RNA polymerase subunit alpha [bacterium]
IGHIAVDAIYTPINHVSFRTENVRVGEMTNWDKLILTLETNGTINCLDAFRLAVNILREQFASLAPEMSPENNEAREPVEDESSEPSTEIDGEDMEESGADDKAKKKRGRPKKENK